jgi:hypothetical protein
VRGAALIGSGLPRQGAFDVGDQVIGVLDAR